MSIPTASDVSPLPFVTQPNAEDYESEKANLSLIFDTYKDRFLGLPKVKGWSTELYMYQGFWYKSMGLFSVATLMAAQETFQARPMDIYMITLPKVGTIWIKSLAFAIVNRTRYKNNPLSAHPLRLYNPHVLVPFIETEMARTNPTYVDGHEPRLFATHIPYKSLPKSVLDSGCRIVYLCRNPKDVLVSLFHFENRLKDKSEGQLTFEEAFKMFSEGVMPFGPYWDHVKGCYEVGLKNSTRILILKYEDMKMDPESNVKRLAEFFGCPFTKEEETEGVIGEIVRLCSFENLSETNKHGKFREGMPNDIFFRKGKVGDSSNYLTTEMSQMLDEITEQKFRGLDI